MTDALNFGSGTSSSELSPPEYCLVTDELVRKAVEFWISGEVRLDPEREIAARDISRYEGWRCKPVGAVEREGGEGFIRELGKTTLTCQPGDPAQLAPMVPAATG